MDQELQSNIDVAKHNWILRLFIGFAQKKFFGAKECSEEDCIAVLNWLTSNKIDLNKDNWYETENGDLIPQLRGRMIEDNFLSWIYELKGMLPILLECKGNIGFANEKGKTILHVFFEDYYQKLGCNRKPSEIHRLFGYLMNRGISVQIADKNGNTPLHVAAMLNQIVLLQIMLRNCTNINARNNEGDTVLHMICSTEICAAFLVEQCVRLVLAKGADVNVQNNDGWTAVHLASKCKYLGVLKIVLEGNANLNLLTEDGDNSLLISCKYAKNQMLLLYTDMTFNLLDYVELLINKGCNVNVANRDGYSPLHYACMCQTVAAAKTLIAAGADVRCTTRDFLLTPLHCAAECASELAKPLVEAGAKVNAKTVDGVTPLHLFSLSGALADAEYLIRQGADVSCREDVFGFTALHMAALQNDTTTFDYFLRRASNVNDGGNCGITALHLAAYRGMDDFVEMLIARGADVHCRGNVARSTALHFAAKSGGILDYIRDMSNVKLKPCWYEHPIFIAGRERVIELLVQRGVDVNVKDVDGRTPLHLATMLAGRRKSIMEFRQSDSFVLLSYGAYLDLQDNRGNLPVHNALKTGHDVALKSLLALGVDVNDADTSRIVVSSCEEAMKSQVMEYLVKLRAAELPVSSAYDLHANWPELQLCYLECLDEVERMRKSFLIDDTTSIYDLLQMGWRRRVGFEKKLPADLERKFPLYAGIIQASCREALQRKSLLKPAELGWYRITEINLVDVCVERILAHLSNRYLRVLVGGFSEDGS